MSKVGYEKYNNYIPGIDYPILPFLCNPQRYVLPLLYNKCLLISLDVSCTKDE